MPYSILGVSTARWFKSHLDTENPRSRPTLVLLIASGWFGARPSLASAQLRAAAEMQFPGVGLLPGNPGLKLDGLDTARSDTGLGFDVAAWPVLAAADTPNPATTDSAELQRAVGAIPGALKVLEALGASALILRGGVDSGGGVPARSERLMGRLRSGEVAGPGDEVAEQLATLAREPERVRHRERQMEGLARFLHALSTRAPRLGLALAAEPSPAGVLDPGSLALLLEDPALAQVGYWHEMGTAEARAQLGLDEPGAWLDRFGPRIRGATLEDFDQGRDALPPGQGRADFRLVAEYLPRQALRVLSLAPSYPGEVVLEARTALDAVGIR